MLLIQQINN